ncbi:MAG TPA: MlaD family protein [Pseudoxanthomonas sp.]|nr:MlaD family protein [Pseudoxanthomonas sp.]
MQDDYATPRRFAGIEKKVSLFLIAAVLVLLGAVGLISYKQGVFVRHSSIYFYAADVFGINKGMAVNLFGLPVGSVKTMLISDRGVKVELSIVSDYLAHVPKGSHARLLREGYIGAVNIQIVPSSNPPRGAGPIVAGDVIEFLPSRGVAELIDEFKIQLTPVLAQLHLAIEAINHPESDFRKSAIAARVLLEQLPATNQEARRVLRDVDHVVLAVSPDMQASFAAAARLGAQAEQQLPAISAKLATALDSLAEAAEQVREQTRKNGEALNETLKQAPALMREGANLARDGGDLARDGGDLVRDGQEILGAARNVWPLSSAVEARTMRTLSVDSFESAGPGRPPATAPAPR